MLRVITCYTRSALSPREQVIMCLYREWQNVFTTAKWLLGIDTIGLQPGNKFT